MGNIGQSQIFNIPSCVNKGAQAETYLISQIDSPFWTTVGIGGMVKEKIRNNWMGIIGELRRPPYVQICTGNTQMKPAEIGPAAENNSTNK